jgi:CheY-like chemotaxis protein
VSGGRERQRLKNRCLVVDDDDLMRRLIELSLQQTGFEVVAEATNAADALEAATAFRPDIVLIDLMLSGIDDRAPIAGLRAFLPDAMIVVLSGMPADESGPRSRQAGADHYLGKSDLVNLGHVLASLPRP